LAERGRFDVAFLRNVMIYFDIEAKKRILGEVFNRLAPDGLLFLGVAETTFNLDERFERLDVKRAGCYRRRWAPGGPSGPRTSSGPRRRPPYSKIVSSRARPCRS
jgi:chemotaxis protein methyltransferase CheR